jgi:hypothetical protein
VISSASQKPGKNLSDLQDLLLYTVLRFGFWSVDTSEKVDTLNEGNVNFIK